MGQKEKWKRWKILIKYKENNKTRESQNWKKSSNADTAGSNANNVMIQLALKRD